MPALFFPNLNALRLALASGLVPPAISRAPAAAGFDGHGRLWLEPIELPSRDSLAFLARLGIQALGGTGVPTTPVSCWAELLPLHSSPEPVAGPVLFLVPDRQMARFVARLRRGSRHSIAVSLPERGPHGRGWVLVDHPPAAVVVDAVEADSPIEAFTEQAPGIWVRHGWRHPIPEELTVPPGSILLLAAPSSVIAVPVALPLPDTDEFRLAAVNVAPAGNSRHAPGVSVRLTLQPSESTERESLWVLDSVGEPVFWAFCAGADERLLRRLRVAAVGAGSESRLVVWAPGKHAVAIPPLPAPGFTPDPRLTGLFVPTGKVLRPVLRVRALAAALGIATGRLVWVEPDATGSVIPHAVAESDFRPVTEVIEYTSPGEQPLVVTPRSDPFPLGRFLVQLDSGPVLESLSDDLPVAEEVALERTPPSPRQSGWFVRSLRRFVSRLIPNREPVQSSEPTPTETPDPTRVPTGKRVERNLASPDALLHGHDWAARRRELEARLFRDLPRLGPAGRADRWADLAGVYGATGNPSDAAVCWMNAAWESPVPPQECLEQWLTAECRAAKLTDVAGGVERWLSEPGRPGVGRVVAAFTAWAGFSPTPAPDYLAALPRLLAFLDQHFDDLPVRAAWLARLAAARVCDGDALGLARWRDRVLARLGDRGPGLDLDEPSFLRFHGTASAERFQTAREWLVRVCGEAISWVKKHDGGRLRASGLDAETECTAKYAQFMFAWGLGCLGERTRAKDWAARARKTIGLATGPNVDPAVHAILGDLFLLRLKDAQEGRPAKPGLPADLQARIDALGRQSRYAVDRFREHSRVLEPIDRVRAWRGEELRVLWGNDRLGERLFVLAERTEPAHLPGEVEDLLRLCVTNPTTDTVPRVVFSLLEVGPRLEPGALLRILDLLPTAIDWMEALLAAQPWQESERPRKLIDYTARMIDAAFSAACAMPADVIAPAVAELVRRLLLAGNGVRAALLRECETVFRALRRLGLRGEAETLVRFLDPTGRAAELPLVTRLGVAVGWLTAGDEEAGDRIINAARESLYLTDVKLRDQTELALAYAGTLGFASPRIAHGRLEEIFRRLPRVYIYGSTNSHFTLQPLRLVDAVVRAVVTDDFTLGPSVRVWLDDDEFLIRGRIHRDLTAVFREQGIG